MIVNRSRLRPQGIVIGLTGGIASGKSYMMDLFSRHGAEVISTDLVAREVVLPGSVGFAMLQSAFPNMFTHDQLDRLALRALITKNPEQKALLESIMHPLIKVRTQELIMESVADVVVIEVPLLFESGFDALCDLTVCTVCSLETQITRLMARDKLSRPFAQAMIAAQMDSDQRASLCDFVVCTDQGLDVLMEFGKEILNELKTKWGIALNVYA